MRAEQPKIGGDFIASLQQDDIPRDKRFTLNTDPLAAPDYIGMWRQHMADGVHRFLCLAFLNKTDNRIGNHDSQNYTGINPVIQKRCNNSGADQYINQD